MATTTNLSNLVINYLTQAQYDAAAQAGTLNENQIYLTPATPLATVATSGSYSDLSNKPTNVSSFTNDAGYLTSSDIASVLTYKGTKATTSALPSSGNKIGDVWHVTANGGEYAWDGSAWQELGSTIDLSNYATKATTLSGYGITDAKIQNGTITLGSNTITPLTSYTETDPVFAASAAAGITATDISNWNTKSDTDENVKITNTEDDNSFKITFSNIGGYNSVTRGIYVSDYLKFNPSTGVLSVGGSKKSELHYTYLKIGIGAQTYQGTYTNTSITANRSYNFPDKSGTVALTSDIPSVYSSTNTSGYLTMATLPIYDGTVV